VESTCLVHADLIELDFPWVIEALEEKFDDALSLLPPVCGIYGGALRDLLAGLPIEGDLDVGIPYNYLIEVMNNFDESARWVRKNSHGKPIGNYERAGKQIIQELHNYTNQHGEDVQLIRAACGEPDESPINEAVNLAKKVDIVCCGLFMDVYGTVYEAVPGALSDCEKRILRLNSIIDPKELTFGVLEKRIKKLVDRGWKSEINIDELKRKVKNG